MKKYAFRATIIIISLVCFLDVAQAETILGIGDSIMLGEGGAVDGPLPSLSSYTGDPTYYNAGVGGSTTGGVISRLSSDLSLHDPSSVYSHCGINDLAGSFHISLSKYLSNLDNILSSVQSAGATLTVNQIIPYSGAAVLGTPTNVKLWNAALEQWCLTNDIKLSQSFQEMADPLTSNEDHMNPVYLYEADGLGVHPNATGDGVLGYLMSHAAIPSSKRVWGAASYPSFGYVSWDWAVLGGTASVTENSGTGVLNLAQNDSAALTVECLVDGSKTINIAAVTRSGSVNIYYRTSATTNFARNDAAEWTSYSEAFNTTDQFIQVKVDNTSAASAVVRYVAMTWDGSAPGEENDPEPSTGGGFGGEGVGMK